MWQGNVARTERQGNVLNIIVSYTNGDNTFDETLSVTNSQDPSWLQGRITNRLNELNALDIFEQTINKDPILNSSLSIDSRSQSLNISSIPQDSTPIDNMGTI